MAKEKDFQTRFNHWLKAKHRKTGAYELKQTKTNSIAFDAVVPHQVEALLAAKNGLLVYKIPDAGYQNPFDCFSLSNVPAYVVIKYPKFFCTIDIDDWVNEIKLSNRKSLTSERASEISTTIVEG